MKKPDNENIFIGFTGYSIMAAYCVLLLGIAGIFSAVDGKLVYALYFLAAAGCMALIRNKKGKKQGSFDAEYKYSIQVFSLGDVTAFGILPALIFYLYSSGILPALFSLTLPIIYVLCAVVRLAYFNVSEEMRNGSDEEPRVSYLGVPVTVSAVLFPAIWCLYPVLGRFFPGVYTVFTAMCSVSFIAPVIIKKPGTLLNAAAVAAGCAAAAVLFLESSRGLLIP